MSESKEKDQAGGNIAELKKYRYQLASTTTRADEYTETTKAIAQYVGRVYGSEMRKLVLYGEEFAEEEPEYPEGKEVKEKDKAIWSKKYDHYLKQQARFAEQKAKVFVIVLDRCDKAVMNRLETSDKVFKEMETNSDVTKILKAIKTLAFDANEKKYGPLQAVKSLKALATAWQAENESLLVYYKRFIGLVEVFERSFGKIAPLELAEKNVKYAKANKQDREDMIQMERDKMLAAMFLDGVNKKIFGFMLNSLQTDHALGSGKYPENAEMALEVLTLYWEQKSKNKKSKGYEDEDDTPLTFVQSNMKCWKCGKLGHRKAECKENDSEEKSAKGHQHSQVGEPRIGWAG